MFGYSTPGVYFEWQDTAQRDIQPARVDIAGFVGIAERGPLHRPERIESWNQFVSIFGRHTTQGHLAYTVQGFFANGGRTCWVVRVADPASAAYASLDIVADDFADRKLHLTAANQGVWSHKLDVTVLRLGKRFSLILRLPDGTQEVWRDLSLDEYVQDEQGQQQNKEERFVEKLLNPSDPAGLASSDPRLDPPRSSLLVRAKVLGRFEPGAQATLESLATLSTGRMVGGADGLRTLGPEHISGNGAPSDTLWGLATLEKVSEISIVAIADIMPAPFRRPQRPPKPKPDCADLSAAPIELYPEDDPDHPWMGAPPPILQLQRELVAHCERLKNRVAILDARLEDRSPQAVVAWRRQFDSSYAALYHPWLRVADPLGQPGALRAVPPSGYIAGIYARVEALTGAHKPPANELVEMARDVSVAVEEVEHGYLNDNYVNVIRTIPGRGLRVSGARTLSSDTQWRYVNVRRLLIMLERAIDTQTQWLVFEANNPDLWRAVERVVRSFLDRVWQAGMLEGTTAAEAYQVTCDATTNPSAETEAGRMITLIGVQPPWPSEFVVVRIGKTESGIEILQTEELPMPQSDARNDPTPVFRFELDIDNLPVAGFSECSGLQLEIEPYEYHEGGMNAIMRKFPGHTKQTNITLKRGIVDRSLWDWFFETTEGKITFRGGSIVLRDPSGGQEMMRWRFDRAFPTKLSGPELNATQNSVAVETLELCHEGLKREV